MNTVPAAASQVARLGGGEPAVAVVAGQGHPRRFELPITAGSCSSDMMTRMLGGRSPRCLCRSRAVFQVDGAKRHRGWRSYAMPTRSRSIRSGWSSRRRRAVGGDHEVRRDRDGVRMRRVAPMLWVPSGRWSREMMLPWQRHRIPGGAAVAAVAVGAAAGAVGLQADVLDQQVVARLGTSVGDQARSSWPAPGVPVYAVSGMISSLQKEVAELADGRRNSPAVASQRVGCGRDPSRLRTGMRTAASGVWFGNRLQRNFGGGAAGSSASSPRIRTGRSANVLGRLRTSALYMASGVTDLADSLPEPDVARRCPARRRRALTVPGDACAARSERITCKMYTLSASR